MAIYIHIPFCGSKCTYCAFYSVASPIWMEQYVEALKIEMSLRSNYLASAENASLYLGGGTPSILTPVLFERMMTELYRIFTFSDHAERTLEANPEDVTLEKARLWYQWGFNRVSLGIQSFDDTVLRNIKRRHSGEQAEQAVRILRDVGFERISGDLIVGLPGCDRTILMRDVERLCKLGIGHISVYMLSVDERTELEIQVKRRLFMPLEEEELVDRFEWVCCALKEAGYEHYEISNFALPGQRAKHNSAYWTGKPYLGLGTSAHSYNGVERHWGVASVKRYMEALNSGKLPIATELLTVENVYNERIMTNLRMSDGIEEQEMEQLNAAAWKRSEPYRNQCIDAGYARRENGRFCLTPKGWLLSDKIFSELFL